MNKLWLKGRVITLLSEFFRETEDPEEMMNAQLEDWWVVLKDLPQDCVNWACQMWHTTDKGKKGHRPTPGQIYALAEGLIRKPTAAERRLEEEALLRLSAPERRIPDEEEAARILSKAGYTPKMFAAVKDQPMATHRDQLGVDKPKPRVPHWSEQPDSMEARLSAPLLAAEKAEAKRTGTYGLLSIPKQAGAADEGAA